MKKILAIAISFVMLFGMSVTAFAEDFRNISSLNFTTGVFSEGKAVTRSVNTSVETVNVSGYYYASEGQDVFRILNRERVAAGLPKLEWVPELVEPAIQRALEQYVLWSHTRPDGSKWSTVSKLANGENLASGTIYDAVTVMDGWMNSASHRENILDKDFTGVAVACVETDKMVYWVQLFNVNDEAKKAIAAAQSGQTTTSPQQAGQASVAPEKSIVEALNKAKSESDTASVSIKNPGEITAAVTKAASDWAAANEKKVLITAITTSGQSTQGQITFDPAKFTSELKTGVRVDDEAISDTKANMNKWYKNKLALIKMDAAGDLAAPVTVVAKANLAGLDTATLMFYSYDKETNKITPFDASKNYSVDKNGFLHFTTPKGGFIIVTDKPLTKQ